MPRFLRSVWFWLIVLAVIAAGAVVFMMNRGAQAQRQQAAAAAARPPESPYAAIANGRADVEGGMIQVAARRAGIVEAVFVQEGDRVSRGQVLARQEDEELRLSLQRAQAELAAQQAQMGTLQVQLSTARREQERMQRLQATNFAAAQRVDQAADAVRQAEGALASQAAVIGTARAAVNQARYTLQLIEIRAPVSGRIARRYANPGAGASTLNVSNMFDLEPDAARIVRAEIPESAVPDVTVGQEVEITAEQDASRIYTGRVLRRAAMFGARRLQSDDPSERTDERVVEVVVTADGAPFLIGQRVLVKFMKPGRRAGAQPPAATSGSGSGSGGSAGATAASSSAAAR